MPDGLRAGLERSWLGGGTFAQACNAASPRPSAGADSLVTALIAEHTGDLIVEIDLTRIGPVSRALPFGSDPPRSAPLRAAALRTAQTMAAEKIDRSRTELPLVHWSIRLRGRTRAFNVARDDSEFRVCLLAVSHLDAAELEETSLGNHSGHAPRASQFPTNVANAFDAIEQPSRSASCYAFLHSCDDQTHIEPWAPSRARGRTRRFGTGPV